MIRLILADDHTMVRQAIAATLIAQGNVEVVAQCGDGLELVDAVLRQQADVVLMDISMPKMNGFTALEKILHHRPETRVIALSMHDEPEYIEAIRLAGARGYVFKDAATEQLLQTIESVMQGKLCFPDVPNDNESRATPTQPLANLTRRERKSSIWWLPGAQIKKSHNSLQCRPKPQKTTAAGYSRSCTLKTPLNSSISPQNTACLRLSRPVKLARHPATHWCLPLHHASATTRPVRG